jgi:1,2-diacylglycerol 3-alpha-glucosyltransferase
MRIVVVFDNFGPYHVARLAAAAKEMDVIALEISPKSRIYDWVSPDMPEGVLRIRLGDGNADLSHWLGVARSLETQIAPLAPDAIAIPGWISMIEICVAQWGARRGIPIIVMSDSTAWDFARSNFIETVKGRVLRWYSAALCGGRAHKAYLCSLGGDPEGIFLGYDAVDNAYFAEQAEKFRQSGQMPAAENNICLPLSVRQKYFLACARFVGEKNLLNLLDAYAIFRTAISPANDSWPLVILGDGRLRAALEARREQLGLNSHVHLPGFSQYDTLPSFYGTAGVFVHACSIEPWGLVVNEAMASGLPVLVSNRCGCAHELVQEGRNGFKFDPFDVKALADLMSFMAFGASRAAMGAESQTIIADWGPERFASGLKAAAEYAMAKGPRRVGIWDILLGHLVGMRQSVVQNGLAAAVLTGLRPK